jgi:hypothetical protein
VVCGGATHDAREIGECFACIVAALMLGLGVLVWFTERQSSDFETVVYLTVIGVAAWMIGRGCRYVLART